MISNKTKKMRYVPRLFFCKFIEYFSYMWYNVYDFYLKEYCNGIQ